MIDRDKVIKGLELLHSRLLDAAKLDAIAMLDASMVADAITMLKEHEEKTKHLNDITLEYAKEVFRLQAMLKEQEAKVLTIDQLEDALDTVVWLETPVSENLADGYSLITAYSHKCGCMIFDSPFGDNPSQDRLEYSKYGKSWRCWDKRPTDEQRDEVKWNDI